LLLSELQDEIDLRLGRAAEHHRPHVNAVVELCVRSWRERYAYQDGPFLMEALRIEVKQRYLAEVKKRAGFNPLVMYLFSILITAIINAMLRWLIEDKKARSSELMRMQSALSGEFQFPDIDEETVVRAILPEDSGYPRLHAEPTNEPAPAHVLDAAMGVQASCCDGARCHKKAASPAEPSESASEKSNHWEDAALNIVVPDEVLTKPRPYRDRRQVIYLAGPMSIGDTQAHVDRAVELYGYLVALGYSVICPQLSHYAERQHGVKFAHGEWLAMDLELVKRCDLVVRLYGQSKGADMEMQCAYDNRIYAVRERHLAIDLRHLAELIDMVMRGFLEWERNCDGLPSRLDEFAEHREGIDWEPSAEIAEEAVKEAAQECAGQCGGSCPCKPAREPASSPEPVAEGVSRFKTGAVRSNDVAHYAFELLSPIGLRRAAEAASEGEIKYSAHNWERGFPISDLLRHVLGHIFSYLAGNRDEDHLGHATWGMMACCHSEELWPHLNTNLRRAGCIPPNVSDEEAQQWGRPAKRWEKPVA
jgi:hypothetical protein